VESCARFVSQAWQSASAAVHDIENAGTDRRGRNWSGSDLRKEALSSPPPDSYGEKIFCLSATLLASGRSQTESASFHSAVVKAALVMFWTRLPSLNALANPAPRFWKQWCAKPLASADTLGGSLPDSTLTNSGKVSSWSINS